MVARGFDISCLWSEDGGPCEWWQVPGGRDSGVESLCGVTDSNALIATWDESREAYRYYAWLDSGFSFGPTDPIAFGGDFALPAGPIATVSAIGLIKQAPVRSQRSVTEPANRHG